MGDSNALLMNEFSLEDVQFSKIRRNKMGGKAVYININNNRVRLQFPNMRAPFGLSAYTDEATKKTSYSLDLSFDPEVKEFQELMESIDEKVLSTVTSNSKEWLGKQFNESVIREALYKPMVKPSTKGDYPATVKLKVLVDNGTGKFVPEAYNMKTHELVDVDTIEKGQRVHCIVEFSQIWFIDNKFGVSLRLLQVALEPSRKLPSFAFRGLPDGVEEEEVEYEEFEEEVDA